MFTRRGSSSVVSGLRNGGLKAMKAEEAHKVARYKKMKANDDGTNPLHKAYYIDAHIDALTAHMSQKKSTVPAPKADALLVSLATELETYQQKGNMFRTSERPPSEEVETVEFGAWRSRDAQLPAPLLRQKKQREVALHHIVQSSLTPVDASVAYFEQQLPCQATAVKNVMSMISRFSLQRAGSRRWHANELRLLSAMSAANKTSLAGASRAQEALLSLVLAKLCSQVRWTAAVSVFEAHRRCDHFQDAPPQQLSAVDGAHYTLLFEAIRRSVRRFGSPPFEVIDRLSSANVGELPVAAAAPMVALLGRCSSLTWEKVLEITMSRLVRKYQGRVNRQETALNAVCNDTTGSRCEKYFLPAIAIGELLVSLHRRGAPLEQIQSVVDEVTTNAQWKRFEEHMKNVHLYNGYIRASPWQHGLTIFETHMPHYGVEQNSSSFSALMASLRDGGRWDLSISVFRALQRLEGTFLKEKPSRSFKGTSHTHREQTGGDTQYGSTQRDRVPNAARGATVMLTKTADAFEELFLALAQMRRCERHVADVDSRRRDVSLMDDNGGVDVASVAMSAGANALSQALSHDFTVFLVACGSSVRIPTDPLALRDKDCLLQVVRLLLQEDIVPPNCVMALRYAVLAKPNREGSEPCTAPQPTSDDIASMLCS